jgi:Ca-activated chloride channel family protein
MTENELKSLKKFPVPPARKSARAAALRASLDAFASETKGNSSSVRRRSAPSHERSTSMNSYSKYAIAASLAVFAIGVPATIRFMQEYQPVAEIPQKPADPGAQVAAPTPLPVPSPTPEVRDERSRISAVAPQPAVPLTTTEPKVHSAPNVAPPRNEVAKRMAAESARSVVSQGGARLSYDRIDRDAAIASTPDEGRDRFQSTPSNPVKNVATDPVSTFSLDVDTSAYAFVRRVLMSGRLPPRDAVRVEEMINYFPYEYARPADGSAPFASTVTVMPAPWNSANKLMHVAIKGYDVAPTERPRANLVFLVDTSGSMAPEDRLPLLKNSLRLLVDTLKPDDTVGIVTYAGQASGTLEPTKVSEKGKILAAIDKLQAGGSTAGAAGLVEAYRMAEAGFEKKAINRVILGTDGDFNVGITDINELKSFVERKRETGVFLSILGFGRGNYNDALMQTLAQNGNGVAAYIDTLNEARKVLADEVSSTLFPIAKDVKIQVEFNPGVIAEYRLIGYETRVLRNEDFKNDKVDAGEIGSGHSVTAIYELTPIGVPGSVDPLRYQQGKAQTRPAPANDGEIGFLKIRYKLPEEQTSRLIELPVRSADAVNVEQASTEVRFSSAVAAFGQLLRGDPYLQKFGYDEVIALANGSKGSDAFGYRAEFVNLARLAKSAKP